MQRKGVTWYWYMVYAVLAAGGLATAGEYKLKLPLGLQAEALYVPEDNQLTEAKVALGKQFYFDKRLSIDNTVSCASCHNPRFGFTDGKPVSTGIKGQKGGRSAPTTINRAFSKEQFWDGGLPAWRTRPKAQSQTRSRWASRTKGW